MLACSCQPPCATRSSVAPRGECISRVGRTKFWTNSGAHYSKSLVVPPEQVDHLSAELNRHFADARVEGFETLVALMTNDPGDRHVIAAAVKCGAEAIVTFNLRHFPDAALDPWNIEAQHPDEFLVHLYHLNPDLIVNIPHEPAAFIGRTLAQLLAVLKQGVPNFARLISDSLGVTETE